MITEEQLAEWQVLADAATPRTNSWNRRFISASIEAVPALIEALRQASAEIQELESLFQRTHHVHHGWVAQADLASKFEQERDAARAELAEAKAVLAWYASSTSYFDLSEHPYGTPPVLIDDGQRARDYLAKVAK